MSEAGIVFKKFTLAHRGKAWELDRPNLATERGYATLLEKKAAEALGRLKAALGPQGYQDGLRLLTADCVSNFYGWCRPGFIESLSDPTNCATFLWVWLCQCYPPGKHDQAVDSPEGMLAVYRESKEECDRLINEVLSDPNPCAPVA